MCNQFIAKYKRIVNALIILANIFTPTEGSVRDYALIRDHILLPLFGTVEGENPDGSHLYSKASINTIFRHVYYDSFISFAYK